MLVDAEEGGATTPAGVTLVILYEQHSEEEEELDEDESAPPSASSRNAESVDATAEAEGEEPWCAGMHHGSNFCSVVLLLFALLINIIYVSRA